MNPITGLFTVLAALITKALPSDEVKLEWMKGHAPRIYYNVRKHILINAFRYIRRSVEHAGLAFVQNYVDFTCRDFSDGERKEMIDILLQELKKQ